MIVSTPMLLHVGRMWSSGHLRDHHPARSRFDSSGDSGWSPLKYHSRSGPHVVVVVGDETVHGYHCMRHHGCHVKGDQPGPVDSSERRRLGPEVRPSPSLTRCGSF